MGGSAAVSPVFFSDSCLSPSKPIWSRPRPDCQLKPTNPYLFLFRCPFPTNVLMLAGCKLFFSDILKPVQLFHDTSSSKSCKYHVPFHRLQAQVAQDGSVYGFKYIPGYVVWTYWAVINSDIFRGVSMEDRKEGRSWNSESHSEKNS